MRKYKFSILILYISFSISGCSKFLDIDPPITTLTTAEVFSTNAQAVWALSGVYSKMSNGFMSDPTNRIAESNFAAGLSTIMGGFSSDELYAPAASADNAYRAVLENKLTLNVSGFSGQYWESAYKAIYDANAVIEGVAASTSADLVDSVRKQVTGEALALRAFSYFCLVNFFGDLPLALTTDFNQTNRLSRSPVTRVYQQIITDLTQARSLLNDNYAMAGNERIRINKWFAEALLARVYLFSGDYQNAITSASNVIGHNTVFKLEQQLSNVFLANSSETILQLKPSNILQFNNATPEAWAIGYHPAYAQPLFSLSESLANAFEPGDKRKTEWAIQAGSWLAPNKYKLNSSNSAYGGPQTEYYMVMRLAELYLIRAEAYLLLSDANKNESIKDLNAVRERTDLDPLQSSLTAAQVKAAIEQERRVELFAEWGHRWFDLKRTNRAKDVLPAISYKQPWAGDYQLLYPIPPAEISFNVNLNQNPLYTR
ncbi:MAG: RagB/SusD family nutrient uptake outer membrane protein [Pseudobacter sp.]|uniref:RagB/SusD family nutrient uptake outer membrane protein n=1 Tax=Pseudobacter sp. TaxID=2045420 RepID=UPI003F7E4B63